MKVLVVDVGTHVKMLATGQEEHRGFVSGLVMTAKQMVSKVLKATRDWSWDVVSVGYPGPVLHGHPIAEPHNLGRGWVGYAKAFRRPVKIINDAAMQALESYRGGKMLFLGLGTGLGSALVVNGVAEPMEQPPSLQERRLRGLCRAARPGEVRQEKVAALCKRCGRPPYRCHRTR